MTVLENRANGHSEFLVALATAIQTGADFLGGVGVDFPDFVLIAVFAVWTHRAIRPAYRFGIFAGFRFTARWLHHL